MVRMYKMKRVLFFTLMIFNALALDYPAVTERTYDTLVTEIIDGIPIDQLVTVHETTYHYEFETKAHETQQEPTWEPSFLTAELMPEVYVDFPYESTNETERMIDNYRDQLLDQFERTQQERYQTDAYYGTNQAPITTPMAPEIISVNNPAITFTPITQKFLQSQAALSYFEYPQNAIQKLQFQKIVAQLNAIADFRNQIKDPTLINLAEHSTAYALGANQANHLQFHQLSQLYLTVSEHLLGAGRGILSGLQKSIHSFYEIAKHPTQTLVGIGSLLADLTARTCRLDLNFYRAQLALLTADSERLTQIAQDSWHELEPVRKLVEGLADFVANANSVQLCEFASQLATEFVCTVVAGRILTVAKSQIVNKVKPLMQEIKPFGSWHNQVITQAGAVAEKFRNASGQTWNKLRQSLGQGPQPILAGEAGVIEGAVAELEAITLKQDMQNLAGGVPAAHLFAEFESGLEKLIEKYGAKIVDDAKRVMSLDESKILRLSPQKSLNYLENFCIELQEILQCGKAHHAEYIYDSAHAFKPTPGSLSEARAACAAENQGLYKKLVRSLDSRYDFVDELGNKIDVKRLISKEIMKREGKFCFEQYIKKIKKQLIGGEHILIDISQAEAIHVDTLKNHMRKFLDISEIENIKFVR